MTPNLFVPPWHNEVVEALSRVEFGLGNKFGVANARPGLTDARDQLLRVVEQMEPSGGWDAIEQHYFHLFDALSFLTAGLQAHPVNRGMILEAACMLRKIQDVAIPY